MAICICTPLDVAHVFVQLFLENTELSVQIFAVLDYRKAIGCSSFFFYSRIWCISAPTRWRLCAPVALTSCQLIGPNLSSYRECLSCAAHFSLSVLAVPRFSPTCSPCRWLPGHDGTSATSEGKKNLRAQTSPAERQTENKVTAETQAVLNITEPPAARTTQLNTSTWKRWWLFLGPYG